MRAGELDDDDCSTLPSPAEPQSRSRILIIDDDQVVTLVVRRLLEPQYTVLTASNGLQGFQAFLDGRRISCFSMRRCRGSTAGKFSVGYVNCAQRLSSC